MIHTQHPAALPGTGLSALQLHNSLARPAPAASILH